MIEKIVLNYLIDKGFMAYMEMPEDRPEKFIIVEKTSSQRDDLLFSSTFAIQSYAPTLLECAELNDLVVLAMFEMTDCEDVTRSKLNTSNNYTDTATKDYRYQAVFDVTHY